MDKYNSSRYMPRTFKVEDKEKIPTIAETISPANWKDYDVVVEHHADDEDAEAEQLEGVEVLPAHTDAGKGKVVKSFEILRGLT